MSKEIVCEGLTVDYGRFRLGPIGLSLRPGITCLVGANGAGKSTLFRLLAGLESPMSGRVHGELGTASVPHSALGIGFMPQDVVLPPRATSRQYLTYAAWLAGIKRRERAARVAQVLADVDLTRRADVPTAALSGGMRRRLGLAQALLGSPDVLLLDEPTVGLDPVQRAAMRELLRAQAADRITVVSTHLVEDVRALADVVVVLESGTVVFQGTNAELEAAAPTHGLGESSLERGIAALMAETAGGVG